MALFWNRAAFTHGHASVHCDCGSRAWGSGGCARCVGKQQSHKHLNMASCTNDSDLATGWRARAAVLTEAAYTLMASARDAAAEADKGGIALFKHAGHFDSVAAALEEDLLALARSHDTSRQRPVLTSAARRVLKELSARMELPPSKRMRQSSV